METSPENSSSVRITQGTLNVRKKGACQLPSQVWGRDPQEAYENPYEYAVQEQFYREAGALLDRLYALMQKRSFTDAETSASKAVWLLHADALDSLDDALDALSRKRHRIAAKMLRDVLESADLAAYFASGSHKANRSLEEWYKDKIVGHRKYRDFVKASFSEQAAEESRDQHRFLSKFTHRTYRVLLDGYSFGAESRLVHDRYAATIDDAPEVRTMLVLPQTIAAYCANLAEMIMVVARELTARGTLQHSEVAEAINASLETKTVPRRFMPRAWLHEALSNKSLQADRPAADR